MINNSHSRATATYKLQRTPKNCQRQESGFELFVFEYPKNLKPFLKFPLPKIKMREQYTKAISKKQVILDYQEPRALRSCSHTSRTAPRPPLALVLHLAPATTSAAASCTAIPSPTFCTATKSGRSSPI
jgi:hypothetical protein